MSQALFVKSLCAGYGDILAVRDVTFSLAEGDILAIVGRNGVGKSTAANAIAGLLPIVRGSVRLGDLDITPLAAFERSRAGIALVPEGRRIFRSLTVEGNLRIGAHALRDRSVARKNVADIGRQFPVLLERRTTLAGSLSGGQQQLLAIAQALVGRPHVLIVDEPTAGLSPLAIDAVFDLLAELAAQGIAIVVIEERLEHIRGVASRILAIEGGRIVEDRDPASV